MLRAEVIAPLQEVTADVSVWMLKMTGIAVYREGLFIELPNGLFEVAEACAGVRFLIANIFVAAIFAYLSFDSATKSLAFMALAVLIPVFLSPKGSWRVPAKKSASSIKPRPPAKLRI